MADISTKMSNLPPAANNSSTTKLCRLPCRVGPDFRKLIESSELGDEMVADECSAQFIKDVDTSDAYSDVEGCAGHDRYEEN